MELLRPHQVIPVEHLVHALRLGINAVDLSDTGTGKTYVAAAVANRLKRSTLAIVPKIAMSQWKKAAEHFGDTLSVVGYEALRTGRTSYGTWDNTPPPGFKSDTYFKCQCCQLEVDLDNDPGCYCHPLKIHCLETKKIAWDYGQFRFHPAVHFTIWDEVHRCGGIDSLNADMLIAARRENVPILGLSATSACGPLEMRALGYALNLHGLGNFYQWTRKYGCGKIEGMPGWHWKAGKDRQKEFMLKLREEIIPARGVRVSYKDIPGFPERTVTPKLFDLDTPGQLDALYEDMREALEQLQNRTTLDTDAEHPLTKMLRLLQRIELLKVPLVCELAPDYIAKGYSVGVFVNYKQTMTELRRRLKCDCFIDGSSEGQKGRVQSIEQFQRGVKQLILVNNDAGGASVSLPDETGENPRKGLVMPPRSARTLKQLLGRFHRESSKSPCSYDILLAAGTAEVSTFKKLSVKLDNLDTLNDGDLLPD